MGAKKRIQNVQPRPLPPTHTRITSTDDNQTQNETEVMPEYSKMSHIEDGEGLSQYPESQQHEYALINSMYSGIGDNFERLHGKRSPWKHFDNLAFAFNITSFYNSDFKARLEIEFPIEYPKVPLVAKLLSLKPRQDQDLESSICEALITIPERRQSDVSIEMEGVTAIVETVQEHLNEAAAKMESRLEGKSLAETRKEDKELRRNHALAERNQRMAAKEAQMAMDEDRLKKSILLEKKRRHNTDATDASEEEKPSTQDDVAEIMFRFSKKINTTDPVTGERFAFFAVCGATVIHKDEHKRVAIVHPLKFGKLHDYRFVLKQIYIPIPPHVKDNMEKSMDEVRMTLNDCKNTVNPALVKIYAFDIDLDDDVPEMPEWRISILTEFSAAGTILQAMKISGGFHALEVRKYANELLQALDQIEKSGEIHPALHTRNMLVFDDPRGGYQIRLSDGYGTQLGHIMRESKLRISPEPDQKDRGWVPSEIAIDPMTRSNKTCIWELAMIVINMGFIQGYNLEHVLTSPEKLKYRDDLDGAFLDFINKAFEPTPKNRPTASELMSHQFFKDGKKDINIPTPENPGHLPHLLRSGYATEAMGGSLWAKKWETSGRLGSGTFGEVTKARNVDDGQYYAVKTIKCANARDLKEIWNEVRLLATLNHPGVVRYYNAWNEELLNDDQYIELMRAANKQAEAPLHAEVIQDNDPFSIGNDFLDPSMPHRIGPEYSSESESNPFGYQSPPGSTEDEETQSHEATASSAADNLDLQFTGPNDTDGLDDVLFEGDNDVSEAVDAVSTISRSRTNSQRRSSKPREVTLYIQMELCETATLSTVIREGLPYRIAEVWRLFRQILEALQHIHEKGIVHRDLKPSNIFIHSDKHVKIGDFGLATSGRASRANISIANATTTLRAGRSSRGIGTTNYVAPELESAGSGDYSSKADMFSLGVIFYQMCYPASTDTERMNHIRQISLQADYQLPAFFDHENYQQQRKIISQLISHNQDDRPSATTLLENGSLPELIDSRVLGRYIGQIKTENPVQYLTLMDDIFIRSMQFGRAEELAYLGNSSSGSKLQMNPQVVQLVDDQLTSIFRRQGAVSTTRGVPLPTRRFYPFPAGYVDEMGVQIQLPPDLTLPFASILADPGPYELANSEGLPAYTKYYCLGLVYRRAARRGAQPTQLPEFGYDQVSFSAKNLSVKDAEVIKVLDQVLVEMPAMRDRQLTIYLNHGDLLNLILEFCKIPEDRWDHVKRDLSYLHVSGTGWSDIRHRLLAPALRISESSLSLLAELKLDGDITQVRQQINRVFDEEFQNRALRPLARLEEIVKYTELLGVVTPIRISPLSNQTEPLYQGSVMFQCVLVRAKRIFAVGGRYDKLIEYYEQPEKIVKGVTRAVGFRINGQILYDYSHTFYGQRGNSKSKIVKETAALLPRRIDVVVTSFDESTLFGSPCMEIVRDLMDCGIKVERSEYYHTMDELDQAYRQDSDFWLVIVRQGPSSRKVIKVRTPARDEVEVRPSELVAYIKSELSEKSVVVTEQPKLKKQVSGYGDSSSMVRIVIPKHKSKKTNRMNISDEVTAAAGKLAEEIGTSAPVVAFAPSSDDILQALRNTRLTDGESWKGMKQMVPPGEKAYIQDVQQELEELASMGKEGAFVVNYLTNSCIYYDFGKRV